MSFEAEQILTLISLYILPFARLSGFLMVLTVISSRAIPPRFRLLLAVAITIVVVPTLPDYSEQSAFLIAGKTSQFASTFLTAKGWLLVIEQTLIGIALGFVSRLLMETFVVGGQIIAMQSGLGFASLIDPANGTNVPALGQFFLMMSSLIFLAVDGHLLMIRLVVESFTSFPIGSSMDIYGMFYELVNWAKWIFAAAILIAVVPMASLLIVNLTFGVMARAAPQINIFAVGFPMTLVSGLILIWLTLGYFLPHFERQFNRASEVMCTMVNLQC
ncbi:MAG: flagellar biosynthetic protein FliR [Kangiella sp.]|nr:MAG: flagellar biosynthetic protein FliR [Kangiella sp.]